VPPWRWKIFERVRDCPRRAADGSRAAVCEHRSGTDPVRTPAHKAEISKAHRRAFESRPKTSACVGPSSFPARAMSRSPRGPRRQRPIAACGEAGGALAAFKRSPRNADGIAGALHCRPSFRRALILQRAGDVNRRCAEPAQRTRRIPVRQQNQYAQQFASADAWLHGERPVLPPEIRLVISAMEESGGDLRVQLYRRGDWCGIPVNVPLSGAFAPLRSLERPLLCPQRARGAALSSRNTCCSWRPSSRRIKPCRIDSPGRKTRP